MKKAVKRHVSLFIAVVMLASLMSISGFAAGTAAKQYDTYTVIGDSIPAGYGLASYGSSGTGAAVSDQKQANGTLVADSYPALVSQAVNASATYQLARCGFRTTEALRMLDPNFKPDEYSDYVLANLSQVTGDAVTALKAEFAQGVKNADLISVNLGSNDTMTFALIYMSSFLENLSAAQKNSVVMQRISLAEQQIKSLGTMGEALFNLLGAAKTLGQTGPALAALSAGMLKGYESFKQNWNILITDIKAANPDAVILAVGMYNPFRDVKFTDASLLSVGRLADQFVGLMNVYMKTLSPCASSYTFVSAADAQVYTFPALTSPDFTKNFVKYVHPDKTGHAYMAQQLLAAVPAGSGAGSAPLFDLQLSGRLMSKLAAAIAAVK